MNVKLSQAFDLQMGKTPSRNTAEYWGGDHKWVSIADIGSAGKYIHETKEYITDKGISDSSIKVVPKDTVIMSFKLSIGKTAITSEDMYTNEAIMAFIDKGIYSVDPNYLYHLCCGTDWTAGTNKAVMGMTLNKATLSEKMINIPSIEEQKDIADKLDAVDLLIDIQRRQLTKLDELVKSRFVEMFGEPMTNPMGWPTRPLSAFITHANNGMSRRGNDKNGSIVLRLVELQNGYIDYRKPNRIILDEAEKDRYLLEEGDFLFARVNGNPDNVGRCAAFLDIGEPIYHNDHIIRVRFDHDALDNTYVRALLNSDYGRNEMKDKIKTSAGQYTINQVGIGSINLPLPTLALQKHFADFVRQADKSKLALKQSLEKLETLKKALMQKYFG